MVETMFDEIDTPSTWEYVDEDLHSTVSHYIGTFEREDGTKMRIWHGVDSFSGVDKTEEEGSEDTHNQQSNDTVKIDPTFAVTFEDPENKFNDGKTLLIEYYRPDDEDAPAAKKYYNPVEATRIVRQVINNDDPRPLKDHLRLAGDDFTELDPIIQTAMKNPHRDIQEEPAETSIPDHVDNSSPSIINRIRRRMSDIF